MKKKNRKISFHLILLIVNFVVLSTIQLFPQRDKPVFEHFSIYQGLSESIVSGVIQDKIGYLWISSWGGILRYDGYSFTPFNPKPFDSTSSANSYVQNLIVDKAGNIWIGTWNGIEKFDRNTGIFTRYFPHPPGAGTEWSNNIISICEDKFGTFWIGTGDGLNILE